MRDYLLQEIVVKLFFVHVLCIEEDTKWKMLVQLFFCVAIDGNMWLHGEECVSEYRVIVLSVSFSCFASYRE